MFSIFRSSACSACSASSAVQHVPHVQHVQMFSMLSTHRCPCKRARSACRRDPPGPPRSSMRFPVAGGREHLRAAGLGFLGLPVYGVRPGGWRKAKLSHIMLYSFCVVTHSSRLTAPACSASPVFKGRGDFPTHLSLSLALASYRLECSCLWVDSQPLWN